METPESRLNHMVHVAVGDFCQRRALVLVTDDEEGDALAGHDWLFSVWGWTRPVAPQDALEPHATKIAQQVRESLQREPVHAHTHCAIRVELRGHGTRIHYDVTVRVAHRR